MTDRITPEDIGSDLPEDIIFVFGSNEAGIHGAGAARLAFDVYGASLNQGFGFSAQTFAIPTKDWNIKTLPLSVVEHYIKRFVAFVEDPFVKNKWKFYVTRIGCGLAGFKPEEIAPLFAPLRYNKQVWLPQDFIDIIDNKNQAHVVADSDDGPIGINLKD